MLYYKAKSLLISQGLRPPAASRHESGGRTQCHTEQPTLPVTVNVCIVRGWDGDWGWWWALKGKFVPEVADLKDCDRHTTVSACAGERGKITVTAGH